jgi:hypothetical protein
MKPFFQWLKQMQFQAYGIAFTLMIVPSFGLYYAAQQQSTPWIWALIGIVVFANVLAMLIP